MALAGSRILVKLGLNTVELERKLRRVERKIRNSAQSMQTFGRNATVMSAPIAMAGAASVKFATDFEASMVKVNTLVGIPKKFTDEWGVALKAMSQDVGRGPNELADALFFVTSAGIRSAKALDIVNMSAQASVIGLGETKTVARTVVAAMQAFSAQNLTAAESVDTLVATVRFGNVESEELAGSMGRVMGIAADMGLTMNDVGAFVAAYTRVGVDANIATTSLRATLNALLKPGEQASQVLFSMGVNAEKLQQSIKDRGLAQTLVELANSEKLNTAALATLIPNVRAVAGVLSVAKSQAEAYLDIDRQMKSGVVSTSDEFKTASQTMRFAFDQLGAVFESVAIRVGEAVFPMLAQVIAWSLETGKAILELGDDALLAQVKIIGVVAVLGPLALGLGLVVTVLTPLAKGILLVAKAMTYLILVISRFTAALLLNPLTWFVAAIVASTVAVGAFIAAFFDIETVNKYLAKLGVVGKTIEGLVVMWKMLATGFQIVLAKLFAFAIRQLQGAVEAASAAINMIVPVIDIDLFRETKDNLAETESKIGATVDRLEKKFARIAVDYAQRWGEAMGPMDPDQSKWSINSPWNKQIRQWSADWMKAIDGVSDYGGSGVLARGPIETQEVPLEKRILEGLKDYQQGIRGMNSLFSEGAGGAGVLATTQANNVKRLFSFLKDAKEDMQDAFAISDLDKFENKLKRGTEELKKLYDTAAQGSTTAKETIHSLAVEFGAQSGSLEDLTAAYQGFLREQERMEQALKINIGEELAASMSEVFVGIARGTREAKDILKGFQDFTINVFGQMFSEMLKSKLDFDAVWEKNWLEDIPGAVGRGMKSVGNLVLQALALVVNALGATFGQNWKFNWGGGGGSAPATLADPPVYAATGGITTGPTLAMVGDNPSGTEAIIPLERWKEVMGGAGGGGTQVVIHAPTALVSQKRKQDSQGREMLEFIFEGAKGAVAQDIISGGKVSQAMSAAFGSKRGGGR